MTDFTGLSIEGRIATPSDADWDEARLAWNLAADLRPSAVAFVESAEDVAETVRFAAENGLRVSGQGTGHGAAPLGPLEEAILIKTEELRGIEVDADRQVARVEAGVLSLELGEAANAHGLVGMPGSSPDVGVVGYTLGGGLSWLGTQARLRLQSGQRDRARHRRWRAAHGRRRERRRPLLGPARRRRRLRDRHRPPRRPAADRRDLRRRPALPGRGRRRRGPRLPRLGGRAARRGHLGRPLHHPAADPRCARSRCAGTPLLTIDGACIGTREEGEAAFAPLREIGEAIMDTFEWMPTAGLSRIHMDPENPVPGRRRRPGQRAERRGDRRLRRRRRRRTPARRCCSPSCAISAAPSAGRPRTAGALSHLDAAFAMYSVGMAMSPEMGEAIRGPPGQDRRDDEALGRRAAPTSTSPKRPATSTRSCLPTSATASAR